MTPVYYIVVGKKGIHSRMPTYLPCIPQHPEQLPARLGRFAQLRFLARVADQLPHLLDIAAGVSGQPLGDGVVIFQQAGAPAFQNVEFCLGGVGLAPDRG